MKQPLAYLAITYGYTFFIHGLMIPLKLTLDHPAGKLLYIIGGAGPLVGAVVVSAWHGGRHGVQELLVGGLKWQFGLQWYLVAALSMVLFYLGSIGLHVLFGGDAPGPLFQVSGWSLIGLIAFQVGNQVFEEYGWRGFLQPLLDQRMGSISAALLVGLSWSAWHLPMFWVANSNQQGSFWSFTLWVLCWSVMMAAIYHQTGGSTLSAMLFHMSVNICFFAIRVPPGAERYMLALEVVGAVVAIPFLRRPFF